MKNWGSSGQAKGRPRGRWGRTEGVTSRMMRADSPMYLSTIAEATTCERGVHAIESTGRSNSTATLGC